jgi:hypothetical protein
VSTPELHLSTLFVLDGAGRIVSTREPGPGPGPRFSLIRSSSAVAWAVRADVSSELVGELARLAAEEPPAVPLQSPPLHEQRYRALLGAEPNAGSACAAFTFPDTLPAISDIVAVEDERLLQRHFGDWSPGEIAAGRAPVMAIVHDGWPVSVCFSARLSGVAAEAGLDTTEAFRGRGFGARVTAAWALAIRSTGRVPLYSCRWSNAASLAVARKLGLEMYAGSWSL